MARAWFGGTSNDWPFVEVEAFGATLIALNGGTVTGTCWDAKVGGTQWTDLLDVNNNPITSFTVTGPDWPEIQGPDNVMGMWFDFGAGRFYVQARDQAALAAASATAAKTSETNAATSETNAAASATSASSSATAAGNSATAASGSASAASTSEANAASSATSAAEDAAQAQTAASSSISKPASPAVGDLLVYSGSAWTTLRATTDGQMIVRDSTQTSGWRFPSALHLEYVGSPEGIKTAPPGSICRDPSGTNGAWVWIKVSGTGNTGWRVLDGEVPWQTLSPIAANGWTGGGVSISRTGSWVRAQFSGTRTAAGSGWISLASWTTIGFTPADPVPIIPTFSNAASTIGCAATAFAGSKSIVLLSPPIATSYGWIEWSTTDPWPATPLA